MVLYRVTKSRASGRLSWVPRPMTVTSAACCRANCSTPGASARQEGQCGAQNHTRSGLSTGATVLRSTFVPAATSLTTMEGNALLAATPEEVGPAVAGGTPPSAEGPAPAVAGGTPPPAAGAAVPAVSCWGLPPQPAASAATATAAAPRTRRRLVSTDGTVPGGRSLQVAGCSGHPSGGGAGVRHVPFPEVKMKMGRSGESPGVATGFPVRGPPPGAADDGRSGTVADPAVLRRR